MNNLNMYTREELEQQMAGAGRIERGYFSETKSAPSTAAIVCIWVCVVSITIAVLFKSAALVYPSIIVFMLCALQIQSLFIRKLTSETILVRPRHAGRSWIIPLLCAFVIYMIYHMAFEFIPSNLELLSIPVAGAIAATCLRFLGLQK